MTPSPPDSAWLSRAGKGFQMSNTRNSRNALASTATVLGRYSTDSSMPATSSMTITPGSFAPKRRSTREPAHTPTSVTPASVITRPGAVNGMTQSATAVSRLPAVPGATGEYPAPPALAMASASRSTRPGALLADQFVTVHLDDRDLGESARRDPWIAEQHHAIDLRRLSGEPPLERKEIGRASCRGRVR